LTNTQTLDEEQKAKIEAILPKETLQEFRSSYIETAKKLREIQQKEGDKHLPKFNNWILNLCCLLLP
jgi:hypothetical protein